MANRPEISWSGAFAVLLLLSAFPVSLWWKALTMRTAEDMITKLGRPVDPSAIWAFSGCLALIGIWAVLKASANANFNSKARLLVSAFVGAFFLGSSGAVAVIAVAQDQLMKGSAGV
jgi:hypothetical protein